MPDLRMTNRLLLGILAALVVQIAIQLERTAQADTLRLDYCITERMDQLPAQYVHVIAHPPVPAEED